MKIPKQHQLTIFSAIVALASVASVIHVFVRPLDELARSREGTPFFTPPVLNPDTGEPIELDALIGHYKSGG